jgi:hypothetical protein
VSPVSPDIPGRVVDPGTCPGHVDPGRPAPGRPSLCQKHRISGVGQWTGQWRARAAQGSASWPVVPCLTPALIITQILYYSIQEGHLQVEI